MKNMQNHKQMQCYAEKMTRAKDEGKMVTVGRERVRTPVTCGECVRHPRHAREVDLSRLTRLHMLDIGNRLPLLYARRR